MAKRATSCLSVSRWGGVPATGLSLLLFMVLYPVDSLPAAEPVPAVSPATNAASAMLHYQETSCRVGSWNISLTLQDSHFAKEPPPAASRIIRGVLNFGGGPSNAVACLWQRDARKLYLDLNRNRDLTDDPAGVFSARVTSPVYYQTFTNVHLQFNTPSGNYPVLADISFYDYSSRSFCQGALRSFWQGRVTLHGRDWQVGIVQNKLEPQGSFANTRLLLRPWSRRNQPFNTFAGSLATMPFSQKLFVDGHAYQVELTAQTQNGQVRPALRFAEQNVALGELKITGTFIQRLVLEGAPYLVILDQPAATVKVPIGPYSQPKVLLEHGGTRAYSSPNPPDSRGQISVSRSAPAILDAGGPLTNSVLAGRQGQDLELNYRMIGGGGATYQLVNPNSSRPPAFAIYKGKRKIASDNFQYG